MSVDEINAGKFGLSGSVINVSIFVKIFSFKMLDVSVFLIIQIQGVLNNNLELHFFC